MEFIGFRFINGALIYSILLFWFQIMTWPDSATLMFELSRAGTIQSSVGIGLIHIQYKMCIKLTRFIPLVLWPYLIIFYLENSKLDISTYWQMCFSNVSLIQSILYCNYLIFSIQNLYIIIFWLLWQISANNI